MGYATERNPMETGQVVFEVIETRAKKERQK
jgi:hypothetical protein